VSAPPSESPVVIALIPAFNEASTIGKVVAETRRCVGPVVVVDDGSNDGTDEAAIQAGAELVVRDKRGGKGVAIREGLVEVLARESTYVLLLDGDGQHDPADAPRLTRAAEANGYDLVIGHRLLDRAAHQSIRYYTNVVACNMLSRWIGHEVLDSQSGFRLIRTRFLRGVDFDATGFEIETEMLLKLCRRGARVGHVEILGGTPTRKSRLRPVRDVTRICLSAVKYQYLTY
jgi:glycosyltransferase involved in cell wall biosynthesis